MELLIATHDLHPDPESGGTGRYVHEFGRRLVARGHDVTVLTRQRGDCPRAEVVAGMRVRRFPLQVTGRGGPAIAAQVPRAYRDVREALSGASPDLVSLQGPLVGQLVDRALPDAVPRSCTFHSPWSREYRLATHERRAGPRRWLNAALRRYVEGRVVGASTQLITLSRWMRERLRRLHEPDRPIAVVPGGVDPDRFHPDAGSYERMAGPGRAILAVRRLAARTGVDLLLRAFRTIRADRDGVRLYVAGDGPRTEEYRALARGLGIADVTTFLGYVPEATLPAAYASADLVAMPSRALEGFGLSTLEALAAGTPVVGTPVGGNRELLGACTHATVAPRSMLAWGTTVPALAARLADWLALPDRTRETAGQRCREFAVDRYRWSATVDRILRHYRGLVEGDRTAVIEATDDGWPRRPGAPLPLDARRAPDSPQR